MSSFCIVPLSCRSKCVLHIIFICWKQNLIVIGVELNSQSRMYYRKGWWINQHENDVYTINVLASQGVTPKCMQ